MQYACRALHYAKQVGNVDLEPEFIYRLSQAPSNLPEYGDGGGVYKRNVLPAAVDLTRVGMHYAASSLFEKYPQRLEFFNYIATSEFFDRLESGEQRLVVGQTVVRSKITHSEKHFSFAVLYLGQLNIIGNISLNMDKTAFSEMYERVKTGFEKGDLAAVISAFQKYFGEEKFTIWELFREEKQKIINQITEKNLRNVESSFRKIYQNNYPLMSSLRVANVAVPDAYKNAVQYVLNNDLKHFFMRESLEISELKRILDEFQKWNIAFTDEKAFNLAASERIFEELQACKKESIPLSKLQVLAEILTILNNMKVKAEVWKSQNLYFELMQQFEARSRAYPSPEWKLMFIYLGGLLNVKVEQPVLTA